MIRWWGAQVMEVDSTVCFAAGSKVLVSCQSITAGRALSMYIDYIIPSILKKEKPVRVDSFGSYLSTYSSRMQLF